MLSVIGKVNARLEEQMNIPNLHFSSVSTSLPTQFPTLSVVSLGEPTVTSDLSMTVQAGIWSTIELQSYAKTTLNDATEILDAAGDIMMSMGYQLIYGQRILSDTAPFCKVARFRRCVGSGDFLY